MDKDESKTNVNEKFDILIPIEGFIKLDDGTRDQMGFCIEDNDYFYNDTGDSLSKLGDRLFKSYTKDMNNYFDYEE